MSNKRELMKAKLKILEMELKIKDTKKESDEVLKQRNLLMHFFIHFKAIVNEIDKKSSEALLSGNPEIDIYVESQIFQFWFIQNIHVAIEFFSRYFAKECSTAVFTKPDAEFYKKWRDETIKVEPAIERTIHELRKSFENDSKILKIAKDALTKQKTINELPQAQSGGYYQ